MDVLNAIVRPNQAKYDDILEKHQFQGKAVINGIEYLAYSKYENSSKLPKWKLKRGIDKALHKFSPTRERLKQKLEERNKN